MALLRRQYLRQQTYKQGLHHLSLSLSLSLEVQDSQYFEVLQENVGSNNRANNIEGFSKTRLSPSLKRRHIQKSCNFSIFCASNYETFPPTIGPLYRHTSKLHLPYG